MRAAWNSGSGGLDSSLAYNYTLRGAEGTMPLPHVIISICSIIHNINTHTNSHQVSNQPVAPSAPVPSVEGRLLLACIGGMTPAGIGSMLLPLPAEVGLDTSRDPIEVLALGFAVPGVDRDDL